MTLLVKGYICVVYIRVYTVCVTNIRSGHCQSRITVKYVPLHPVPHSCQHRDDSAQESTNTPLTSTRPTLTKLHSTLKTQRWVSTNLF